MNSKEIISKLLSHSENKLFEESMSDNEIYVKLGNFGIYKTYDWKEKLNPTEFNDFIYNRAKALLKINFFNQNKSNPSFLNSTNTYDIESFLNNYNEVLKKLNLQILLLHPFGAKDDCYRIFVVKEDDVQFMVNFKSNFWSFKSLDKDS
mgnify:CR=1 FL=1